jgi:ribose 5-phosphate isomerase B
MRIGIGSDHIGFLLKEHVAAYLTHCGHDIRDFGVYSQEPADYPDIACAVAEAVAAGVVERAILVCGTGLGMAIAANKVPGIFAAPVTDLCTARLARESNDAQIITLGARIVGADRACLLVQTWLSAHFRGGASGRKVARIRVLEERYRSGAGCGHHQGGPPC